MRLKRLADGFLDFLFPPRCVFCSAVLPPGKQVCASCEKEIKRIHFAQRMILPETGDTIFCIAPYPYEGKVRDSIIRFKFYDKRDYAAFFAEKIAEELMESKLTLQINLVTSVPISKERLKKRGYNQSELIAKETVKLISLPYLGLLEKRIDNREQHKLDKKERGANVRGVYRPVDAERISGKRILLIDDIVTTGATLSECAKELYLAGADSVVCAVAAKVAHPIG